MSSLPTIDLSTFILSFGLEPEGFSAKLRQTGSAVAGLSIPRLLRKRTKLLDKFPLDKIEMSMELYVPAAQKQEWIDHLRRRYECIPVAFPDSVKALFSEEQSQTGKAFQKIEGKIIYLFEVPSSVTVREFVEGSAIDLDQLSYDGRCHPYTTALGTRAKKGEGHLLSNLVTQNILTKTLRRLREYQTMGYTFPEYSLFYRELTAKYQLTALDTALLKCIIQRELVRDGLSESLSLPAEISLPQEPKEIESGGWEVVDESLVPAVNKTLPHFLEGALEKFVLRMGFPASEFFQKLFETRSVIAGSALIQCALWESYPGSDLDVYTSVETAKEWEQFLHEHGYTEEESNCGRDLHYKELGKFFEVRRYGGTTTDKSSCTVNLMIVNRETTIKAVIDDFDLDLCRLSFDGASFHSKELLPKIQARTFTVNPAFRSAVQTTNTLRRIIKYWRRGFTFTNLPEALKILCPDGDPIRKEPPLESILKGEVYWLQRQFRRYVDINFNPLVSEELEDEKKKVCIKRACRGPSEPIPVKAEPKKEEPISVKPEPKKEPIPAKAEPKKEEPIPAKAEPKKAEPISVKLEFPPVASKYNPLKLTEMASLSTNDTLRLLFDVQDWKLRLSFGGALKSLENLTQLSLAYQQNRVVNLDTWRASEIRVTNAGRLNKIYISVHGQSPIIIAGKSEYLIYQDIIDASRSLIRTTLVSNVHQYLYEGRPLLSFN